MKIKKISPGLLLEMLRFSLVGGVSFLLDFFLLYVLTEYGGLHYLLSAGLSFSVSVVFNYWLCLVFVFKGAKKQTPRQRAIFIGSSIAGLLWNQLFMWIFVDLCAIHYLVAKILATALVTIWNYVLKRKAIKG